MKQFVIVTIIKQYTGVETLKPYRKRRSDRSCTRIQIIFAPI